MKKKSIAALLVALALCLTACGAGSTGETFFYDDGIAENGGYDGKYFYRNDLTIEWFADPGVIYITEGEDAGYFYAYGTCSNMNGGFRAYRSKNLADWECVGVPFVSSTDGWGYGNFWAPEILYYEGLYYLYYSAAAKEKTPNISAYSEFDNLYLGVAVSDSPRGPFVEYASPLDEKGDPIPNAYGETFTIADPTINFRPHLETMRAGGVPLADGVSVFAAIDASPFVDDNGDLYLYFVRHLDSYNTKNVIYGMKMLDPVTPDYSTVTPIASPEYAYYAKTNGVYTGTGDPVTEEGNINEAPFMTAHTTVTPDGKTVKKYYLTYSGYGYGSPLYRVNVATSDSPLGRFEKLPPEIATPMHGIAAGFDHMSGTAHHCFVDAGGETFIFYHAHVERNNGSGNPRALAVDRVYWMYDETLGYDIYHSNGPTYSLAPIPDVTSGNTNLALKAAITATNAKTDVSLLNDSIVPIHGYDEDREFRAEGSTTITIKLPALSEIESIFIYNSYRYQTAFDKVDSVVFSGGDKTYAINNLRYDPAYVNDEFMRLRPGSAAVAAFEPITADTITIKICGKLYAESKDIGIGDIAVMGKAV